MIIYFLRHASAGQRASTVRKDEKRRLDEQGIDQCRYIGRALASADIQVDVILSSPLKRATQTAAFTGNELGYEGKVHVEESLRPDATYEAFRDMLRKYSKLQAVMLVGHNPTISAFCSALLSGGKSRDVLDLKKGAVAQVELFGKGSAVLIWCLTPKLARAMQASQKPKLRRKSDRK